MAGKDEQKHDGEKQRFPFEIKDLDSARNTQPIQLSAEKSSGGLVQVGLKNELMPTDYINKVKPFYDFEIRPDDVFVVTFPRSGTTWTQEIVWLLINNLDYKTAADVPLEYRFPFLESSFFRPRNRNDYGISKGKLMPSWQTLNEQSYDKRRFIKTHLPFKLLAPNILQSGSKVVYVARNPKDMIVSYYHFAKINPTIEFMGDFTDMWSLVHQNLIYPAPYWEHVKEAWSKRNENNLMFIFYEDMIKDLKGTINKLSVFFGQSYASEQLDELAELHMKFDNFKNNKSVDVFRNMQSDSDDNNKFIRKGKMGAWKKYFSEELEEEADEWIAENLKDSDLKFPIEIFKAST